MPGPLGGVLPEVGATIPLVRACTHHALQHNRKNRAWCSLIAGSHPQLKLPNHKDLGYT
jgi:hypothetical protein